MNDAGPETTTTSTRSTARRIRSAVLRGLLTVAALALSWTLLTTVFDDLDAEQILAALRGLTDAERIALASGAGLAIAAQGLVTASTVERLPVRRGVMAYLGPAAVASVVPGPSDLPVRYRMLGSWGYSASERALAVTASGIFSIGSKLLMPVLAAIVALVAGITLGDGVGGTIALAGAVLGGLILLTIAMLSSTRLTGAIGYWLQAPWDLVTRPLRRSDEPLAELLARARESATSMLRDRWPIALWSITLYTAAQVALMVLAIRFMGVPDEALGVTAIFVAYGIVQGLTVLPITAGNVGVAETAWIGLLGAIAGSGYINEVTAAVILYRVLTWLIIIPLGAVALAIWRWTTRTSTDAPA